MNEEQASAYGKAGAKYGAKFGKKAAQSETGRAAGRAALKAGTDAAVEDVNQRYLGGPGQEPPPQTAATLPPSQGRPPPQGMPPAQGRPPPQGMPPPQGRLPPQGKPPSQSGRSYTSTSSGHYSPSHDPSHSRTSSHRGRSSSKSKTGGGWNLFKKKDTPASHKPPAPRKPITKHAITKAGNWDKEIYCWALYNFRGELPCDLEFVKGQRISIITRTATQNDWWEGTVNGKTGIFPANYVSL